MVTNFFGHQVQAWRRREPLATDLRLAAGAGLGLVGAARRASGLAGLTGAGAGLTSSLTSGLTSRRGSTSLASQSPPELTDSTSRSK